MVTAEVAKRLLALHGEVCPQPPSDWTGVFPIPPAVKRFFLEVGPTNVTIEAHGNPYYLPSLADLWQFQAGYRWNGLSGEPIEDWPDDWLVVADEGGDPFVFVRSSGVVLHAYHGEGEWDAGEMFPDLNTMAACLAQIGAIVLESGKDYTEEDCSIRSKYRALASSSLQKLLGSKSEAEAVLGVLGWGENVGREPTVEADRAAILVWRGMKVLQAARHLILNHFCEGVTPNMKTTTALLLTMLVPAVVSAQQEPTTGYAPVNGLKMYYEVHGSGEPVVLLHGAFMTITNNWTDWIGELSKTRQVIAVEMQGHGRTADIDRDITSENLADDVAALLDHLKIPGADLIGYSMGGGVAMQCAVRHPDNVRKVVVISSPFRRDGVVKEGADALKNLSAELFKDSPLEVEYQKLSPTPDDFPKFVEHMVATASKEHTLDADKLKATTAPMFFIHGDADGIRLDHIAEMFRLKGGGTHGDLGPRSASRLAILPDTTHVTLMQRMAVIVPMVNDFLDAKP